MRLRTTSLLLAALSAAAPGFALACACFTVDDWLRNDAELARTTYAASATVVRVRVVKVISNDLLAGSAEVVVTEAFKGGTGVNTVFSDSTMCGYSPFRVGDEFLVYSSSERPRAGQCNLPMEPVLEVLRKLKR